MYGGFLVDLCTTSMLSANTRVSLWFSVKRMQVHFFRPRIYVLVMLSVVALKGTLCGNCAALM